MSWTVPCICCGEQLEPVLVDAINQPDGGTAFSTPGHFGSGAFDPMDGSRLEINLCDRCLVKAGREGRVLMYGPVPKSPPPVDVALWELPKRSRA